MMLTPPPATTAAPPSGRGRRLRHRVAYLLIALLLLFIVVLLPFALRSILADFRKTNVPDHAAAAIGGQAVDRGSVAMDLIGMN